jgi:hypothetical protein
MKGPLLIVMGVVVLVIMNNCRGCGQPDLASDDHGLK